LASTGAGEVAASADAVAVPGPGPWRAFAPRLGLWVGVLLVVGVVDPDPALSLMLVALAGVITIVSDSRFAIERRVEAIGLPSREAWVPLVMLGVLFGFDLVDAARIGPVTGEQGPVILFILSFALVSEGLGRSGFFHFLAFRLAERGGADTIRLILYLFLLSSLLTYWTSNDIVVLTMTPIVLSVVYQARIRNAKLLLLSQFVAANTVSMGLLIGSPTNLIVGRAIDLGFLQYFLLMAVPSLMGLVVTFAFVTWINHFVERHAVERDAPRSRLAQRLAVRRRAQGPIGRFLGRVRYAVAERLVGTWKFSPVYSTPRFAEYRSFSPEMGQWIAVFALAVLVLAFGAGSSLGLLLATVVIATLGLTFLRRSARQVGESTGRPWLARTFRVLPVGIVFFGMTYFFIADAIANEPFVQNEVEDFVADHGSSHSPVASWGSILGAGALVNSMNDLPASALSGEVLAGVEEDGRAARDEGATSGDASREGFETPFDRILVAQGLLVGLNIGTYVTPVGALAGIIWFDILRKERQRRHEAAVAAGRAPLDVVIPERRDLVVYGAAVFLVVGFVVGATNFGFVSLADWLAGPRSGHTGFGEAPAHTAVSLACLVVAVVAFNRVLRRHGVALTHLGDLLFLMTRVRLRAARHRVVTASLIFTGIFMASAALLYNIELFHDAHYSATGVWGGSQVPDFDGPAEFVLWLHVFITSGYEGESEFPDSVFGRLVAPVLVLGAIASVVFVVRTLLTGSSDHHVRRRIATGEIPGDRIVVVNVAMENLRLVDTLASQPRRFVTVATNNQRVEDWLESRSTDRMAVVDYGESTRELVLELRLHEAREIVLLSRSLADDFDNLDLLTTLDAVVGGDSASNGAVGAAVAAGAIGEEEGAEPPAILLQRHGAEMLELVRSRLSARLQASLVDLAFDDVVRRFLTANAAGHIEDLRQLYAHPELGSGEAPTGDPADDPDRYIRIEGLQLSLGVDDRADATHPIEGTDVVVGIQVMSTVRPDWRTFAARRALELPRQVTGTVLLGARDAHQGRYDNSSRSHVYVVGSDGLAQQCALDLASVGVEQVTLLMGTSDTLVPGFGRPGNVEVRKCASEVAAVEVLLTSEARDDEAILLVESFAEGAFDTEKLLQRLSVERLHQARSDAEKVAPLYVCCRGPHRSRRIRNYVVDEIIDATWVEASYFAVFTNLYLDAMIGEEAIANWPQKQRLDVADRVAHQLCHLELVRPSDLWADEPGAVDKTVLGMSGAEAVREDRAAGPARGPLVGVVRFDVELEAGDADVPVVAVRVDVPPGDERIEPDDLLVCLPCL
jgi:Na+/H+ antiporter NhaD/arsenite permease-like protein